MNETQRPEQPSVEPQPIRSRRRFLGAGVVVPPTLLTLASQPALGVTCFTPSRSLSRNTSVSQQGKNGECTGAESPGNYKAQQDSSSNAYHWPATFPPSTKFHSVFSGSRYMVSGVSLTLGQVLNLGPNTTPGDPGKVAFHLIGAFLNINGGNGAVIPPHIIDSTVIKNMWTEWDTKGYYEPMAGVKWYADYTMVGSTVTVAAPNGGIKGYLLSNGIVK
ncbi:hypothetical protein [Inhella proteolytica]|uniref:Uncharacterized protein n=1 Tax=Inhella proteolytica TaxID=2795029 RepID=A0A931J754_9BURK|nr:hypothetical protein [Inhella proteolytica]MBH9577365.1 hypothetical protein [Inhella proteolytica]